MVVLMGWIELLELLELLEFVMKSHNNYTNAYRSSFRHT
jgi:hypothetical protein